MKSAYLNKPFDLSIQDTELPAIKNTEVLLKIKYIGVCGSDRNSYLGKTPLVKYPIIMGHEVAATIVETGPDVPSVFKKGMNVTINPYTHCGKCSSCRRGRVNACEFNETMGVQRDGAMREYAVVSWEKLLYNESLGLKDLVLIEPLSVGFHAVSRGRVTDLDHVAVIGCGMIGIGAIIRAVQRGATVIAIDIDDAKLQLALRLGALFVINSSKENVHDVLQQITGNAGPDVVIEAVGTEKTYLMAIDEVAFTGRVVYIGYAKKDICFATKKFVQKEIDILGSRNALAADFQAVVAYLGKGNCPVDTIVTSIISLKDLGSAFLHWTDQIKILVEF